MLANPPFNVSDWGGKQLKDDHVLTTGRHVDAEAQEADGEPFEKKMKQPVAQLRKQ